MTTFPILNLNNNSLRVFTTNFEDGPEILDIDNLSDTYQIQVNTQGIDDPVLSMTFRANPDVKLQIAQDTNNNGWFDSQDKLLFGGINGAPNALSSANALLSAESGLYFAKVERTFNTLADGSTKYEAGIALQSSQEYASGSSLRDQFGNLITLDDLNSSTLNGKLSSDDSKYCCGDKNQLFYFDEFVQTIISISTETEDFGVFSEDFNPALFILDANTGAVLASAISNSNQALIKDFTFVSGRTYKITVESSSPNQFGDYVFANSGEALI